jgi:hypothetical protein
LNRHARHSRRRDVQQSNMSAGQYATARSPIITFDQDQRMKRSSALRAIFRSYAGMTRIRFKGPAHRHLSTVQVLPSEFEITRPYRFMVVCKDR